MTADSNQSSDELRREQAQRLNDRYAAARAARDARITGSAALATAA